MFPKRQLQMAGWFAVLSTCMMFSACPSSNNTGSKSDNHGNTTESAREGENPGNPAENPENTAVVTIYCQCNTDLQYVKGKGENRQQAEQSAQNNCQLLSPAYSIKNCKTTDE